MTPPERLQSLRRWEECLEVRLSSHGIVREHRQDSAASDAVWLVGFRDDTRAQTHVTKSALRLEEEECDELLIQLKEMDWISLLKAAWPGKIRIDADGGIEEVDSVGPET